MSGLPVCRYLIIILICCGRFKLGPFIFVYFSRKVIIVVRFPHEFVALVEIAKDLI